MTSESYNTGVGDVTTRYQYDRAGNRTRMTSPTSEITRYTYDKNDQLTRIDLPDNLHYEKYTYDDRGNLVQTAVMADGVIPVPVGNPMLYEYNARDQLTRVELPTTERIDYEYDHNSLRTQQNVVGLQNPTLYLWDEFSQFGDVILETGVNFSDDSYYRKMDYVLTGGMLVSQTDYNGNTQYFLSDAQGTTRSVTDDLGAVTSEYQYDAFGNLDETIDPFSVETTYLYTGQQFDPYTELYSLRARYYDPTQGRFLTRDTWAYNYSNPFELNRYAYAANNPATYTDPSGYVSESVGLRLIVNTAQGLVGGAFAGAAFGFIGSAVSYIATATGMCGEYAKDQLKQVDASDYIFLGTAAGTAIGAISGAGIGAIGTFGAVWAGRAVAAEAGAGVGASAYQQGKIIKTEKESMAAQ